MGWTVQVSNAGGGKNFCAHPEQPWSPPSLLYNEYKVSLPEVKQPRHGINHPPLSSAEVNKRVQMYLYSPSGSSWPVVGSTLLPLLSPTNFSKNGRKHVLKQITHDMHNILKDYKMGNLFMQLLIHNFLRL
jgi:hypothetical protein